MRQTRAVLLDLDGTLIDSRPGIAASCRAALRALGHTPDDAFDITPFIGPPLEDVMRAVLRTFGDDRLDDAVTAYRQHYGESGFLGSTLYPGVAGALDDLRQAGVRLTIATSKREVFARRILEHLELAHVFAGIYGSVPGGARDHKPELLAHIVAGEDLQPSHAVMVGDRRHDIAGAHAVGMRGVGVLWGYGSRDELAAAGAHRLVERPADLAGAVLAMLDG